MRLKREPVHSSIKKIPFNLKTGKSKAIRFSTIDAIYKALDCQPADILETAMKTNSIKKQIDIWVIQTEKYLPR